VPLFFNQALADRCNPGALRLNQALIMASLNLDSLTHPTNSTNSITLTILLVLAKGTCAVIGIAQKQKKLITDQWVRGSWQEYLHWTLQPEFAKAKDYYFQGCWRIETMGVGPLHARLNTLIILLLGLFCRSCNLPIKGLTNASYRRSNPQGAQGPQGAQPDISYYIGDRVPLAPQGSGIADLSATPAPDLAIEIADSSLEDDLGRKRLLYEQLGIQEYWVVDIPNQQIWAFEMIPGGSRSLSESLVLPNFSLVWLEQVLVKSQSLDDGEIMAWLGQQFGGNNS
jgi:Uma2 family endonuclease